MTQRKIEYWVIPPQADAEFVANMEQVLDLYQTLRRVQSPKCVAEYLGRSRQRERAKHCDSSATCRAN